MNRIYKKSNLKYGLICLGSSLAILVAGCSSDDIALDPTHATYSYERVKDQPITLPANYNKNNFRKLLLGVAVNDIGVKAGEISPNVVQTLSSRLQTEMAKLSNFLDCEGAVRWWAVTGQAGAGKSRRTERERMPG